jgi:DNA polymerase III subunit gamma/tau
MAGEPSSMAPGEPGAPQSSPAARAGESLALYRRYRPASFAELKGQEQVTEPLTRALRAGRISHAYLFSGPRGCGKTTSARIMARSLNCAKGPTPEPCGVCESCVALAPNGPGSIDVIEIDAASHGGVDDARDLRERAFYSPVSGRFKVYIIDEAHMVTREGFNALLKLVEEPPAHLKFIFATTEPEKVIATIRSRTHHYPFRLVPPAVLRQLLGDILTNEGVRWEPEALQLVIRAGAGSVRDSLSVLDQLLAGSDEAGLTYEKTSFLLGYTDSSLLEEVTVAFANGDGAAVFHTVDRVVEAGLDPRRFAADMLDRFRDLIVLKAVPDAGQTGLIDAPADRLERMRAQTEQFGQAGLTRAAEVLSEGLVQMRGATSPRLLLELMCAQVLLPGVSADPSALLARLERLERGIPSGALPPAAAPAMPAPSVPPAAADVPAQQRPSAPAARPAGPRSQDDAPAPPARPAGPRAQDDPSAAPAPRPAPADPGPAADHSSLAPGSASPAAAGPPRQAAPADRPSAPPSAPAQPSTPAAPPASPPPTAPAGPPGTISDAASLRQAWDAVLSAVKPVRRVAWILLSNATVRSLDNGVLTLAFPREGDVKGFTSSECDAVLKRILAESFGLNVQVKGMVGTGDAPPSAPAANSAGSVPPPSEPSDFSRTVQQQPPARPPAPSEPAPPRPAPEPPAPSASYVADEEDPPFDIEDPDEAVNHNSMSGLDAIKRELGAEIIDEHGNA